MFPFDPNGIYPTAGFQIPDYGSTILGRVVHPVSCQKGNLEEEASCLLRRQQPDPSLALADGKTGGQLLARAPSQWLRPLASLPCHVMRARNPPESEVALVGTSGSRGWRSASVAE